MANWWIDWYLIWTMLCVWCGGRYVRQRARQSRDSTKARSSTCRRRRRRRRQLREALSTVSSWSDSGRRESSSRRRRGRPARRLAACFVEQLFRRVARCVRHLACITTAWPVATTAIISSLRRSVKLNLPISISIYCVGADSIKIDAMKTDVLSRMARH